MVIAVITLGTCYGDAKILVEVLGIGPRPGTAWICALNGLEPFTKFSHGGPYQDSTAVVLISQLRNVRIESIPDKELIEEPANENGIEIQIPTSDKHISADWFLESIYEDRTGTE